MKPIDMGGRKNFFSAEDFEGNHGQGRFVILAGSRLRLTTLAEGLGNVVIRNHPRGFDLILGSYDSPGGRPCDVALVCTGIGAPSFDAVFHHLVRAGARRFIRLGTCGSLQPHLIRTGDVIIAAAAYRDEGASASYIHTPFPAIASPCLVNFAQTTAADTSLRGHVFTGIVHTKDSLFAREFHLSLLASNDTLIEELKSAGILASDMETSHFYILSSLLSYQASEQYAQPEKAIQSLSILAVVGDDTPFSADSAAIDLAERRAAELCFGLIARWDRESIIGGC